MKMVRIGALLLLSVMIVACTTARIEADYNRDTNFNKYQTYAWLPSIDTGQNSIYKNEIVMNRLQSAVNNEMQARGLTVSADNPDLLVMTHVNFSEETDYVRRPVYNNYSYYYRGFTPGVWQPYYYSGYTSIPAVRGTAVREVSYVQGTVVVDVIDRQTNEVVWRGWSIKPVDDEGLLRSEVQSIVDNIFDKYPIDEQGT